MRDEAAIRDALRPFSDYARIGDRPWQKVAETLPSGEIELLFRALVLIDREPAWMSGSVAPAIAVFRVLQTREMNAAESAAEWALRATTNPYIPFGSDNLGARSIADLGVRTEVNAQRKADRATAQEAAHVEATERWAHRRQAHAERADIRRAERASFVAKLAGQSVIEQLTQLARDAERPPEWYPESLAESATRDDLAALPADVRGFLVTKLKGKRRGPWVDFKRRVLLAKRETT